jgi:hypothetical protein
MWPHHSRRRAPYRGGPPPRVARHVHPVVRATTLSPIRSTSSNRIAYATVLQCDCAIALRRGSPSQSPPARGRLSSRFTSLRRDRAVWSLRAVLLWRSPSFMRLMMSTHGKKNSPPGYSNDVDWPTPRRSSPARGRVTLPRRLGVDDRYRRTEDRARAEDRALAHSRAFEDHAAAADEGVVLNNNRHRVRRFQHAANAHAAGEVDVGARSGRNYRPSPRCRPSCSRRSRRRC